MNELTNLNEKNFIDFINTKLEYQINILRRNYIQLENVYDKKLNVVYSFDNNKISININHTNNLEIKNYIKITKDVIKQSIVFSCDIKRDDIKSIKIFSEENIKSVLKLNKILSINDINFKQIKNFKSLSFSNFNSYFENFDILSLTTDLIIPEK